MEKKFIFKIISGLSAGELNVKVQEFISQHQWSESPNIGTMCLDHRSYLCIPVYGYAY